jgi:hypothetical protein
MPCLAIVFIPVKSAANYSHIHRFSSKFTRIISSLHLPVSLLQASGMDPPPDKEEEICDLETGEANSAPEADSLLPPLVNVTV